MTMRDVESALSQLGCRSTKSIDAAKAELAHLDVSMPAENLVQAVRPILSKLAVAAEQQSTALTLHPVLVNEERAVLERLGHKVEALETKLTITKTKLKETDSILSQIKEQILLGQAAYTFANLVEDFAGVPTEQLQTLALQEYPDIGLTTEQQRRWEQVQSFATVHVGQGQLIKIDTMLRKLGHFTLPHGKEKNKKKANLTAMEGWAERYYQKPSAVNAIKGYLRMLSQFSDSVHPLLPNKKMADVLLL